MTEVRYYCPRCKAVATLDRDAYLADKSVTPTPLEGWEYAAPYEDFEDSAEQSSADHSSGRSPREDADGVEIVCGGPETESEGCGEVYYLNFVKYEDGEEVEPRQIGGVGPPSPSISSSDDSDDDGPRFDFEP